MLRHLLFVILIFSSPLRAQVPAPRESIPAEGAMTINVNTAVLAPDDLVNEAQVLSNALGKLTGFQHR
ncbi:hypothetical protein N9A94_04120, partial [Akkermansiaceae bacterium]|nr:hypothetical protein [Akkermansiaceae bacterium]